MAGETKEHPSSRLPGFFEGAGLAVTSLLVILAALEGALRLWDWARGGTPLVKPDPQVVLYRPHPYLPIALRPSSDYRDGDTSGRINSLGLRGPERTIEKPPGVLRVLCVGGSTTFGAGILGDENTWPARLESHLAAGWPNQRVEVWNAGVPGYTTAENIIYLGLTLVDFHPDLVIFYEGYNDFKPNRHPGFRADYSHWRDRAAPPVRSPLARLRLYEKLDKLARRFIRPPTAEVRDAATGAALKRYDTVSEEGLSVFRRNLHTLAAIARSAGARVAFATYAHPCTEANLERHPDLFVYLPGFAPTLTFNGVRDAFRQYNDSTRAVAAEEHAILVDAEREIPPDPGLFVDHVHYNAAGADAFARVAAAALLPALRNPEFLRDGAAGPPARH